MKCDNPWTPKDEKEHLGSKIEWWATEAFFTTVENNKKWSFKGNLVELNQKPYLGSVIHTMLHNLDKAEHFTYNSENWLGKLKSEKDHFEVSYENSYIKGSFPNYHMKFIDKKNRIEVYLKHHMESLPHWIGQEITDGWLPQGISFFRYGYVPKSSISGKMIIKNKPYTISGTGYFEHVWGDFLYRNPLFLPKSVIKSLSIYAKIGKWWLHHYTPRFPKDLTFTTENNPLGYDWAWVLLDNGWTIFYGNRLFWLMNGPAAGILILSKDGKKYQELGDIRFKYNTTSFSKNFDFIYPSDFEITSNCGKIKIFLRFKMNTDIVEHVVKFREPRYWLGFVICGAPGTVDGYYFDGKKKTKLSGICKIEVHRQVSIIGHNSLRIEIAKPPKGLGISFCLDSHYLRKKINSEFQLFPRPKIKFTLNKTKGYLENVSKEKKN